RLGGAPRRAADPRRGARPAGAVRRGAGPVPSGTRGARQLLVPNGTHDCGFNAGGPAAARPGHGVRPGPDPLRHPAARGRMSQLSSPTSARIWSKLVMTGAAWISPSLRTSSATAAPGGLVVDRNVLSSTPAGSARARTRVVGGADARPVASAGGDCAGTA